MSRVASCPADNLVGRDSIAAPPGSGIFQRTSSTLWMPRGGLRLLLATSKTRDRRSVVRNVLPQRNERTSSAVRPLL